jgi:F-type H+-transporting ATPase subunit alpha
VELDRMDEWKTALLRYMDSSHPEIGRDIVDRKVLTEENEARLRQALDAFKSTWH